MTPLTYEQRLRLRELIGAARRRGYRRELRMNLTGETRPIDKRATRLGALR